MHVWNATSLGAEVEIVPREVADAAPAITGVFAPPKVRPWAPLDGIKLQRFRCAADGNWFHSNCVDGNGSWCIIVTTVGRSHQTKTSFQWNPVVLTAHPMRATQSLEGPTLHPDAGWRLSTGRGRIVMFLAFKRFSIIVSWPWTIASHSCFSSPFVCMKRMAEERCPGQGSQDTQ